jgi:tRNA-specific 2-thiouridylase
VNGEKILAQPRYRTPAVPVSFDYRGEDDKSIDLIFEQPQRAITPGQVCAFYSEDVLLGGGIFESVDYTK